jgi:hypothetical protein
VQNGGRYEMAPPVAVAAGFSTGQPAMLDIMAGTGLQRRSQRRDDVLEFFALRSAMLWRRYRKRADKFNLCAISRI